MLRKIRPPHGRNEQKKTLREEIASRPLLKAMVEQEAGNGMVLQKISDSELPPLLHRIGNKHAPAALLEQIRDENWGEVFLALAGPDYPGRSERRHKRPMLTEAESIFGGELSLLDNDGKLISFCPEDVRIEFGDRKDLNEMHKNAGSSGKPHEWEKLIVAVGKWTDEGDCKTERKKILVALLFKYASQTGDYTMAWNALAAWTCD